MLKPTIALLGVALLAMPALAEPDMTGSYAEMLAPAKANPGDTPTYEFYVHNGSPDFEWTTEARFVFPETFHITEGWFDDGGAGWSFDFSISGDFDNIAHFLDADGGYGEIINGTGGHFYVTLYITPNSGCGPYLVQWIQYGDGWGSPPHWIGGDLYHVLCASPNDENTFSSVKSLY